MTNPITRRNLLGVGAAGLGAAAIGITTAPRAEAATPSPTLVENSPGKIVMSFPLYSGATQYKIGRTDLDLTLTQEQTLSSTYIEDNAVNGVYTKTFTSNIVPGNRYRVYYQPIGNGAVKRSILNADGQPEILNPLPTSQSKAEELFGVPRSGLPWHSGVWMGGGNRFTVSALNNYGTWRGSPMDMVTTYSPNNPGDTYASMSSDFWSISVWNGFLGKLNYSLAPLPPSGEGSFATIAAGAQDAVWTKIAQALVANGRGTSNVRIAWECNYAGWRHSATASTAAAYKSMWRRIASVMKSTAPDLKMDWGISIGDGLSGSSDRLAALNLLYPGDDVVDVIHGDTYDFYSTRVTGTAAAPNDANLLSPANGAGLADLATFGRAHDKGIGLGEWGLFKSNPGGGDNPAWIKAVNNWLVANQDIVAYECYFDETAAYINNSLVLNPPTDGGPNPNAAALYKSLF